MVFFKQFLICFWMFAHLTCFCQQISTKSNKVYIDLNNSGSADTLTAATIEWLNPKEEKTNSNDGKLLIQVLINSKSPIKNININLKKQEGERELFVKRLEGLIVETKKMWHIDGTIQLNEGTNIVEIETENQDGVKSSSKRLVYVKILWSPSSKYEIPSNQQGGSAFGLHPLNPHYFQYQNKAMILVGSSEHYGAVINKAFDFKKYLETVANDKLNYVRVYGGSYLEKVGDFGIQRNTLAPSPTNLLLPWKRSDSLGYFLGGNKFDISQWNEYYFKRLTEFLSIAKEKHIVVELTLFSSFYGSGWKYSPFNPANNINNTDNIPPINIHTLENGNILKEQERYVRKIVKEINQFDNFYFEIQNEPWGDQVDTIFVTNEYDLDKKWISSLQVVSARSKKWQAQVAQWIRDEEKVLKNKHLISEDISNFSSPIEEPDPNVDIYNFHYANKEAVQLNYYLGKPIGFNETGFAGKADQTYRRQAWRFIMSGGALFNQLDFSFSVGREGGTDTTYKSPGGGSISLRHQLGRMKEIFEHLELSNFKPDKNSLAAAPGYSSFVLSDNKTTWLVYLESQSTRTPDLKLDLPRATYHVEWIDVKTGNPFYENATEGKILKVPPVTKDKLAIIRKI